MPAVPEGAAFMPWLYGQVAAEIEPLARRITDDLRASDRSYAAIPYDEQLRGFAEIIRMALDGVGARRLPTAAELDEQRAWGRRYAECGLELPAMVHAYQYGATKISARIHQQAAELGRGDAFEPLTTVNLFWAWLQLLGAAAMNAYTTVTRSRERSEIGKATRLVESLFTRSPDDTLARSLGLDPDGQFQVICCRPADVPEPAENLLARLRTGPGTAVAASRNGLVVVVVQDTSDDEVLSRLGEPYASGAGVGLARPGLAGAVESLTDAEGALLLAGRSGRTVRFEDDWLPITLLPELGSLADLADAGEAAGQKHLLDAVLAYAGSDFSLSAAAKSLHLHPNTLKYRLDRWHQFTGWNPQSFQGLHRSLLHSLLVPTLPCSPRTRTSG